MAKNWGWLVKLWKQEETFRQAECLKVKKATVNRQTIRQRLKIGADILCGDGLVMSGDWETGRQTTQRQTDSVHDHILHVTVW